MSEEEVFLAKDGVRVTNARFIVHGETYSVANTTSVKSETEGPERGGPLLLGFGSFVLLALGDAGTVIGVLLALAAIVWWRTQTPTYSVKLSSSSGEVKALSSSDHEYIASVVNAINQAMVARG